jgi:hypothetical protein
MFQSSRMLATMTDTLIVLEGQLRECYGRVVYTHKTHEKCADLLFGKHKLIKLIQIGLSAIVTGGILGSLSLSEPWKFVGTIISAALSTMLLALNSYTKDYDLGAIAQKHRQAAADIWLVRERYLSLLTDLRSGALNADIIRGERDKLLKDLHTVYAGAPSTNFRAYLETQKALKSFEDMTFSDDEIDAFLPKELKRKA